MAEEVRNLLLDCLPAEMGAELRRSLTAVPMPKRTVLYEPHKTPRFVHFMTSGIASVVVETPEGGTAEVNVLGNEALVEGLHLLGPTPLLTRCFIQVEGTALRMPLKQAQEMFAQMEPLRALALEFVQNQSAMTSQIAACNRLHGAEERLARWLLMVRDRLKTDTMAITQDFLASMVGARRSTVALATGALQKGGLISCRRGHVTVEDREGLISVACDCYPLLRQLRTGLYQQRAK